LEKLMTCQFPPLRVHSLIRKISAVACLAVEHGSGAAFGGYRIMNARRLPTVAAPLCGTVVLAGWVVASLAGFGMAGSENTGAMPVDDRRAPSLTAAAELPDAPQAIAMSTGADPIEAHRAPSLTAHAELPDVPQPPAAGDAAVADVMAAAESVTATDATAASDEPNSIVEAALPDSSQTTPPKKPPVRLATASTADPVLGDAKEASSVEIIDECLVADICIDRYLWALYQRTPKEDSIKVHERRKVTVKKKGKTVTVTKSFTKLVDEDFTWKDPKAAEKAGMPMMDYVIGGMDRSFKLKLFHTLRAAEEAGLSPGITSAFRDDYRQSIASGLKAATDRSYHGGSFRGGYGHGLAADVVSVNGATRAQRWVSTESLWKWIDAHGTELGIGRPYLDRDPPHLAPIDGKEYAAHQHGTKVQHAESHMKKRNRLAARHDHSVAKSPKKHKMVALQRS
jgi:hypothetical protein